MFVDLEGEDVPDHFDGNEADLSDLIVETLALAIDLYPRRDSDSIESLGVSLDEGKDNPFAALEALKPRDGKH